MSDPIDLGDFGLAFGDEQFRRDEEARRAVDAELRREATERAFEALARGGEDEPPQGNREPSSAIADFNRWQLERPVTTGPYAGTGAVQSSSGTGVRFPPGSPLPLAPRAQEVQRRLDSGDAAGVERDVMGQEAVTSVARPDPAMARSAPMEAPARDMGMSPPPTRREMVEASRAASPAAMLGNPREEELSRKPTRPMTGDPEEVPGAPSLADIGRARGEDVARRILHALGSGLAVAGGRSATPFRSNADAMQERRDEALQRNATAKRTQLTDERQSRALDLQEQRAASEDARAARTSSLQERRLSSQERLAAAQAELASARTGRERITAQQRIEAADPDSAVSARARARYLIEAMNRERVRPGSERIDRAQLESLLAGLSAADIEAMEGEIENVTLGSRRHGGVGGTGGGANRTALEAEATRLGVPAVSALTTRQLQSEIMQRTRAGRGAEGEEILPGVRAGLGLERGEARRLRERFGESTEQYGALNEIEAIAGEFGGRGVISPAARGRMVAPLTSLRAMVARMQNTGVINPSEAPTIEAMLPDPTSLEQMTFETLDERLRSFRSALDRSIQSQLRTRGVSREGQSRALELLHGGDTEAPTQLFTVEGPGGRSQTGSAEWAQQFRNDPRFTVRPADAR